VAQPTAQRRAAWIRWHRENGTNVTATARHFGVSRTTIYRWLKRAEAERTRRLVTGRSRPLRRKPGSGRPRKWWHEFIVRQIAEIDRAHPRWGRRQVHTELDRRGWSASEATVGRILRTVRSHCPICLTRDGVHSDGAHDFEQDRQRAEAKWG
jgi:transposase